jgi:hypothetical protein
LGPFWGRFGGAGLGWLAATGGSLVAGLGLRARTEQPAATDPKSDRPREGATPRPPAPHLNRRSVPIIALMMRSAVARSRLFAVVRKPVAYTCLARSRAAASQLRVFGGVEGRG